MERAAAVLQDVSSLYETDIFRPVIAKAEELAGREWGNDPGIDRAIGAIAEHSRSAPAYPESGQRRPGSLLPVFMTT